MEKVEYTHDSKRGSQSQTIVHRATARTGAVVESLWDGCRWTGPRGAGHRV